MERLNHIWGNQSDVWCDVQHRLLALTRNVQILERYFSICCGIWYTILKYTTIRLTHSVRFKRVGLKPNPVKLYTLGTSVVKVAIPSLVRDPNLLD